MGEPRDPRHPREVLEAIRRLEDEVDTLRSRAQSSAPADPREALSELLAADRQAAIEDLERVVELIGASWRSTRRELADVTQELAGLRAEVRANRASLAGARLEVHLPDAPEGNGSDLSGRAAPHRPAP